MRAANGTSAIMTQRLISAIFLTNGRQASACLRDSSPQWNEVDQITLAWPSMRRRTRSCSCASLLLRLKALRPASAANAASCCASLPSNCSLTSVLGAHHPLVIHLSHKHSLLLVFTTFKYKQCRKFVCMHAIIVHEAQNLHAQHSSGLQISKSNCSLHATAPDQALVSQVFTALMSMLIS